MLDFTSTKWLKQKYEYHRSINPRFSLRAFARKLEMSSGHLSQIFSGQKVLGENLATKICRNLGVNEKETEELQKLVALEAELQRLTKNLQQEPLALAEQLGFKRIAPRDYLSVSHWHYDAVFKYLKPPGLLPDEAPRVLARDLNLPFDRIEECLARLKDLELLDIEDGRLTQTCKDFCYDGRVHESLYEDILPAMKSSQEELFQRGLEIFASQNRQIPHLIGTNSFLLDDESAKKVASMLVAFSKEITEICSNMEGEGKPKKVYFFNHQFFPS